MNDYKKPDDKKLNKVASGKVKKKSGATKFTDVFMAKDVADVKDYLFADVLIPAFKKLLSDIVTDGIDMILYGDTRGRKGSTGNRVSYRDYYDRRDSRDRDRYDRRETRTSLDYDLEFDTRGDAEQVLTGMDEALDRYGVVSVADLYDLAGITNDNFAANKYGWTTLRTAEVVRINNGYLLKMPRPKPID